MERHNSALPRIVAQGERWTVRTIGTFANGTNGLGPHSRRQHVAVPTLVHDAAYL